MTTTTRPTAAPTTSLQPPERPWQIVTIREVLVKLTDKTFVFSTAFMVVMLILGVGVSAFMAGRSTTYDVGVTQDTADVVQAAQPQIADAGDELQVQTFDTAQELRSAVLAGDVDAGMVHGDSGYTLLGKSTVDQQLQRVLASTVSDHVVAQNAADAGTTLEDLRAGSTLTTTLLGDDPSRAIAAKIAGFVFAMIFYMAALLFGMSIANSVLEEKQNRVVEILATAIPIRQILYGKVLGNSLLAFAQIALFAIVGLVGVNIAGLAPEVGWLLGAAGWFIAFFVAGFLALACIWAALGAMASRSEDLQSSTGPVIGILMAALFVGILAQGTVLKIASFVPLVSSVAMPVRLVAGDVPLWQPVLSLAIAVATAMLLVRLGERIYRRAIMHGGAALNWRRAFRLEE